jgi:hypothetical protein
MNYETAKLKFEDLLKQLQRKLRKYAESDDASQKAVDTQTSQINTMIDFLNASDQHAATLDMAVLESKTYYSRLHSDTEKLVLFCRMHKINPDMIFLYSRERLQEIVRSGMRIIPGGKDFNNMTYHQVSKGNWEFTYEEKELMAKHREYENEYFTIAQYMQRTADAKKISDSYRKLQLIQNDN